MLVYNKILDKIQKSIVKNSPTILSVMGGVGAIASVALAADATLKSKQKINEARDIRRKDMQDAEADISLPDKAAICIKEFTPTILMLLATETCIYESNKINQHRLATIAGAYILTETNFKEYKEQVEEMFGEKKAQELKDSIVQKHIDENPPTSENTVKNTLPNATQLGLWYDETSKRYFYSNAEYIRKAEIEANALLQKNGFVSINDIYEMLGVETIPLGEEMGWQSDMNDEVIIRIDAALMGPDIPVGTITMEVHPSSSWISAV